MLTMRLRSPLQAGALGLLALLAACAAPQRQRPAPPVAPPPPKVEETRPTAPPAVKQQNRVALLAPLSGGTAAVGRSIANAANLALLDLGDTRVALTVYDTAEAGAAAAAQRALADGARLFLGPLLAPDVRAVQPIAQGAGVPIVTFSNDAALAGGGTYVMGFQPGQSVARVVDYARSRGVERFAALVPAGAYGQRASNAFVRAVQGGGGQVVSVTTFQRDRRALAAAARRVTDYDARLKRAGAGAVRPDGTVASVASRLPPVTFQALMIADSGTVAGAFVPGLQQFGVNPGRVVLLGTELWNTEPALARQPAMAGALFASVPDARFQQFAGRYRTRFGGQPSRLASLGYDAMLLVNALAGRWPLGAAFPTAALSDPDGFAGVDGIFRFRGGIAERGLEVQEVRPGGFVTVSPAPTRFGQ